MFLSAFNIVSVSSDKTEEKKVLRIVWLHLLKFRLPICLMMTAFKQTQTILLCHSCVCEFSADVILKLNGATQIRRDRWEGSYFLL